MKLISFSELKEKIEEGYNIEEMAKDTSVYFFSRSDTVDISPEKLKEIANKAPGLLTNYCDIPSWGFLLLLSLERFDIVDDIVSAVFARKKSIRSHKYASDVVSVTKEQILMLLTIMEKRKNLFPKYPKDNITRFLIENFIQPLKDYLTKEQFLLILEWAVKEIGPYFFKNVSSDFFENLSLETQQMQEKLVRYFISAHPAWLFDPQRVFCLFLEKAEKINKEFFVSFVVKFYSKLHDSKKVYLLNFPYFIENYPHLAISSLKIFSANQLKWNGIMLKNNSIFLPNKVWDILAKENPLLLLNLIKQLPVNRFSFDINYVSDIVKIPCFIAPEETEKVYTRLKILKGILLETPIIVLINEISSKASHIASVATPQQIVNIIKFVLDKLPPSVAFWLLRILVPSGPNDLELYGAEETEKRWGHIKPNLKEVLTYFEAEKSNWEVPACKKIGQSG